MSVLAFVEARAREIRSSSADAIGAARLIADAAGDDVDAIVIGGAGAAEAAATLGQWGVARVHVVSDEAAERYTPALYRTVLVQLAETATPRAIVFPGTVVGRDLAPRVAARLGVGYAAECVGLEVEGDTLVAVRPRYAGKVLARERFTGGAAVLSVRGNAFPVEVGEGSAEVVQVQVPAGAREGDGVVVKEVRAGAAARLDVAEAPVVVSGGRGLREPENFRLLEELAEALGNAAVGASRAVVDAGWRPHAEQVGQTGKTVAPQLYFAIGISGAIQHLAGMRTAGYIVAINKDRDAPIFRAADAGLVGDLFEIVPRLTEEIRKLRG